MSRTNAASLKILKGAILFALAAGLLLPLGVRRSALAEEESAPADLTAQCTLHLPENDAGLASRLSDNRYNSRISFTAKEELIVEVPDQAKGLYIAWYTAPEASHIEARDSAETVLSDQVASPDLLIRQGTPQTVEDLAKLDSIAIPSSEGRNIMRLLGPDGQEDIVVLHPRYLVDDLLVLRFAALAGTGFCWLPDYLCQQDMQAGRLVRLLPDWSQPKAIVHAVFPSRRGLVPAVRSFLDFLGETVPERSRVIT